MSVNSQIDRLNSAKESLRTEIQNKGVSVPSSSKLEEYSNYVKQIHTGDMQKSVYDPRGINQDIFSYCDDKIEAIDGGTY